MGIEPTAQAWEAWVLPLYDARAPLFYCVSGTQGNLIRQEGRQYPLLDGHST